MKGKRVNPVDTGRKLNVHEAFRKRPGRLLKVLCTFNLGPVSTGKETFSELCQTFLQKQLTSFTLRK